MADNNQEPTRAQSVLVAASLPILRRFIKPFMGYVCDTAVVDFMIRKLSPAEIEAADGLPVVVAGLAADLSRRMFKNAVAADLVADSCSAAAEAVADKIRTKGGIDKVSPDEYENALKQGAEVAAAKQCVIVDGLLHAKTCFRIQEHLRPQRQGKDQPPKIVGVTEVTLGEAAEMSGLLVAPCCHKGIDAELNKPTAAPKPAKVAQPRSPMEIIMRGTEVQRFAFFNWYGGLDAATRERVSEFMKHLDSSEEFVGLVYMITEQSHLASEMLTLLENANGSHKTEKYLKKACQALGRGSDGALRVLKSASDAARVQYRELDASLAPVVQRLEANAAAGDQRRNTLAVLSGIAPQQPRKRVFRDYLKAFFRMF
jgi:hypothetical protein